MRKKLLTHYGIDPEVHNDMIRQVPWMHYGRYKESSFVWTNHLEQHKRFCREGGSIKGMYTVDDVYERWVAHGLTHGWWDGKSIQQRHPEIWWNIPGIHDPEIRTLETVLWAWWMKEYGSLLSLWDMKALTELPYHQDYSSTKAYIQKMDHLLILQEQGVPSELLLADWCPANVPVEEVVMVW